MRQIIVPALTASDWAPVSLSEWRAASKYFLRPGQAGARIRLLAWHDFSIYNPWGGFLASGESFAIQS